MYTCTLFYTTVRPWLSGHVGTGTYPDKRFVRIWELHAIMYVLIAIVFVTNYHSYKMDIE